jgi:hypothetical protein
MNLFWLKRKLWNTYNPVQAEIVGKIIMEYDNKNGQIAFGNINTHSGIIVTKDSPSTGTEIQIIEKKLTVDITFFIGEKATVTKVSTTNAVVTNYVSAKDLKIGKFVYAAIKAEKAIVKISKKSETEIKPEELAKKLEKYIRSINPIIAETVNLVKEISSCNGTDYEYEITNPNVYLMFQAGELLYQGVSDKWFKNFCWKSYEGPNFELSKHHQVTCLLSPVISRKIRDKVTQMKVQLAMKILENVPNLFVRYTTYAGTEDKLIPMYSSTIWNEPNFIIKEYDLDVNHYKEITLEIDAKLDGEKIIVKTAKVKYPEKTIRVIKL